jgi:hypothetical protein
MGDAFMNCEEFQVAGLDLTSAAEEGPRQRAVREHLRTCPHCAALHESWLALRSDLHALGVDTQAAATPSRVELRLRQEFRTKHKTLKARRAALITGWALAAAAVLVGGVTWVNWRKDQKTRLALHAISSGEISAANRNFSVNSQTVVAAGPELGQALLASNDSGDFTLLPGSMPGFLGDATVVRVEMQRGALGALGFTVDEEHAADLIQVELLLGDDGQPQAVRLPETSD